MKYNYNDYELFYMACESEDALSFLIEKYEPLFRKLSYFFIRKFPNNGLDIDDLIQHCRYITCYAVDKFSESNGILFYSYLLVCLRGGLNNYVRKYNNKEIYYYMDYDNYENFDEFRDDKNSFDCVIDSDFERDVIGFKYNLSFLDSCIFELRYNGFSYKEIASLLEVKLKKVDNSLRYTRKKLEKHLLFSN